MSTATTPQASTAGASASPVTVDVTVRIQAIALPESDGRYTVLVPALPGCVTQADSIDDVAHNAAEAAEAWLESQHDRSKDAAVEAARG